MEPVPPRRSGPAGTRSPGHCWRHIRCKRCSPNRACGQSGCHARRDRSLEGGSMRFVRTFERGWRPALVAILFAAYPAFPHAQTTSAAVDGTVQDTQGGVLPGATVTLTSRTQGNVLTASTDSGGRFVFPIVRPDTYTIKAELQGFKTLERTNRVRHHSE